MDIATSKEFFDVYKGVLSEYANLAEHFTTGVCVALEVRQDDAVNKFRELCGPYDPEIAKTLRPDTIRAMFGNDRVRNAVHCTDLEEDAVLEVNYIIYFFRQNISSKFLWFLGGNEIFKYIIYNFILYLKYINYLIKNIKLLQ